MDESWADEPWAAAATLPSAKSGFVRCQEKPRNLAILESILDRFKIESFRFVNAGRNPHINTDDKHRR